MMISRIVVVQIFTVALTTVFSAAVAKPTSEIPQRREFPIHDKIKPCQDFYQHACGKVIDSFKLRDDRSYHAFAFSDSAERLLETKKEFLAGIAQEKNLTPRGQTLAQVYGACTNEKARTKEEKSLVQQTVAAVSRLQDRKALLDFVGEQVDSANFSFVAFGAYPNQEDSDWNDIFLDVQFQTLPERSYYEDEKMMASYQALLAEFFKTVEFSKKPDALAKAIVKMETQFAATYPLPAEFREIINKPTSISRADLIKKFPEFRLADFLKRIPKRTLIRDLMPMAFAKAKDIMAKTPLETLQGFYLYRELSPYLDDAYPAFYQKKFDFRHDYLGGPAKRPDRAERCTRLVMRKYAKEIDYELVDRVFPGFPEKKFVALAEKVRQAIISGIESNQWLSKKGKQGAIEKMKTAELMLVKPHNDKEWDFNPLLKYDLQKPIANSKKLAKALNDKKIKELSEKRYKRRWLMGPLTVNAYYVPSANQFVMPIGILQYPFYDPKLPEFVNLGAVGAVIGHELGHGIDDKGAKYNSEGRLDQWMPDSDLKKFHDRGAKLVSQFDAIGHNGKLTLGENIGDLVGLSFAYAAAFPGGKGKAEDKQKFFLQYARLYCQVIRPKFQERLLKTDPHSLGPARVNEQVKHQPGFAQAFSCKKGDPMTLAESDRVVIW